MRKTTLLLLCALTPPAFAGDLWEITSTSAGPDGAPLAYTDRKCLPKDGMNASQLLDGLGNCTFDQKSGGPAAMTFSMTCKVAGMPANLSSMKVSGDASLTGDRFDMRYTMTPGTSPPSAADFKMTGSATARKVGQCEGP